MENIEVPRRGYIISRRKLLNVGKNRDLGVEVEATSSRRNYTDRIDVEARAVKTSSRSSISDGI